MNNVGLFNILYSFSQRLSINFFSYRQLGYRNSTKLVPLVQDLGQQIHLFLAEYNRYNSDSTSNYNPQNNATICDNVEDNNDSDSMRSINLPGFRRRSKTKR